jgi:hypothetical protein
MRGATLRVNRVATLWRDRLRKYKVLLDGEEVGEIANGETAEFPVSPGHHRVRMAIAWTGSPEVEADFGDGRVVVVECRAKPAVTGVLDMFKRTSWVRIRVLGPEAQ